MKKVLAQSFAAILAASAMTVTAGAQEHVLKLAHDNNPDPFDNPGHACAAVFANIVNSDTNGEVEVEIYPNDQIGTNAESVQMVRDGVIQATISSTGSLASYYPKIDVLNLPFAFSDNAATYKAFDGKFGKALKADIEKELDGVKVLAFPDTGGFFAVTTSTKPINTLEDFEGVRLRTMTLSSHQVIMNALGAEAYPLAWGEVYSALQTGVIDGQMNPVPIISFSNFSEVQKHLALTNHLFSPYIFLLSESFWDGLTEDQQNVVRYAAQSCVAASRGLARIIEASDRGVAGLREKMEVTALTPEQRTAMREATQPAFEKHIQTEYGEDAVALLELFKEEAAKANQSDYLK
ncbi:MAG: C4-dicarboxylate ABC transporter substrate-binding protein [Nitratireductor sp.]|uniref:TRAP transporter substrate-binding protein n=1 Tax=Nitratireductor sp. B36 TaxID=2762059 RepID=UPI000C9411ED|nr:DctP family TRAP transporter solute-binding subunit [Nitratireductor sp. B36]MAS12118.1 C4-dicarboxylate ABC transporter substrate-binding protein [Nitratireductor sp.]MCC5780503.1 DctP family TRAP transporter solute-binding subunit [Nitratireductor sp. B36]